MLDPSTMAKNYCTLCLKKKEYEEEISRRKKGAYFRLDCFLFFPQETRKCVYACLCTLQISTWLVCLAIVFFFLSHVSYSIYDVNIQN